METTVNSTSAVVMRLLTDADKVLEADRATAKYYIAQATAILRGTDTQHKPAPGPTSRGRLAHWQISKINAYLEEHLETGIEVATLARISRLSVSYFPVTFKYTFGETLHAHLTRRRIERSQDLMLTTELLLGQIALACGFYDHGHFCRVFRRQVGVSPKEWRQRTA